MKNKLKTLFATLLITLFSGCSNTIELSRALPNDPDFAPILPLEEVTNIIPTGSLFNAQYINNIYSDLRAHQVGDIISVILSERTQAVKTSNELKPIVGLGGGLATINGNSVQFGYDQSSEFTGEADVDQSNSLTGNISVHVLKVLPNDNLVIRGEKWVKINNGDEYILLKGVIRALDISADNTILSNKIANARIQYAGTGDFADIQEQGWFSKFFNSTWWPF